MDPDNRSERDEAEIQRMLARIGADLSIAGHAARAAKALTDVALAGGATQEEIDVLLDRYIPYYPTEESS